MIYDISRLKLVFCASSAIVILFVLMLSTDMSTLMISQRHQFLSTHYLPRKPHLETSGYHSEGSVKHNIVVFNPPFWLPTVTMNDALVNECPYRNCRITYDKSRLRQQSAIIFSLTGVRGLPPTPPINSSRNPDQAWIFFWLEAPTKHSGLGLSYKNQNWRNAVNWTMSYTRDSDIVIPYGYIRQRNPPGKNYAKIFHRKTKMAAWVVSKCRVPSRREIYVDKLSKHGFSVDIYGSCGKQRVDVDDIGRDIDLNYKFYLAFENSLCKDYITEKFFYYSQFNIIPVVRGGGNYSFYLPKNAFINTADFKSIKELAQYLVTVATNEKLFTDYLRNKDRFEFISGEEGFRRGMCTLCEKLNNIPQNRRIYTDFVDRVHKGACTHPTDIHSP